MPANHPLPTLYDALPLKLGGRNVRPTSASISRLLPFPIGSNQPSEPQLNSAIRHKTLLLHDSHVAISKPSSGPPVPLRRCARAGKLKLRGVEANFATYAPLRRLWQSYARNLFKNAASSLPDRILRMDLHGALVRVVRAKDPSLVGVAGVLVAETANTIVVVTEKNRALTVPKNVAVVQFAVDATTVELILPALCFRASERSARKIKKKHTNYL